MPLRLGDTKTGYSVRPIGLAAVTLGYIHKVDAALISAANRVSENIAASMDGEREDDRVAPMSERRIR